MDISVSVMMHPTREKYKDYLSKKLGNPPIIMDRGMGIWDTCRRAWLAYDPTKKYHIVVQDDMIIGNNFLERAEKLMTKDMAYNFYMGNRPRFASKVDHIFMDKTGYLILSDLCHEACWGIRTSRVKGMIDFCDNLNSDNDRMLNTYINKQKLKVYFPIPSYVDHRSEPSIHNLNRGKYKQGARYFIGE